MNPPQQGIKTAVECAVHMDWGQVVANGGPPCFSIEDGTFCGRAKRWEGHADCTKGFPFHRFVSLSDLLASIEQENQRLREALLPFAKFGERLMDGRKQVPKSGAWYGLDSGTEKEQTIDIEHFKAAIKALATKGGG